MQTISLNALKATETFKQELFDNYRTQLLVYFVFTPLLYKKLSKFKKCYKVKSLLSERVQTAHKQHSYRTKPRKQITPQPARYEH